MSPIPWQARAAYYAVCFFWGTTNLAIRLGVDSMPPALFAGVRHASAGVLLFGVALLAGYRLPRGREWFDLALTGVLLLSVANGMVVAGQAHVPTGLAILILAVTPFWLLAHAAVSGEGVSRDALVGFLLAFAGLVLLVAPDLARNAAAAGSVGAATGHAFAWGCLAMFAASIVWAGGMIYAKRYPPGTNSLMTISMQMLSRGAALLVVGLAIGEGPRWHPDRVGYLSLAYLVFFGSIVGFGSFVYCLKHMPASQVSTYSYLNVVVGVVLGVVVLGERVDVTMTAGTALVLAGVVLANRSYHRLAHAPAPPPEDDPEVRSPQAA